MIKVNDNIIEAQGDIIEIASDIHKIFSGMRDNLDDDEFHHFKQLVIWGIFETQCTPREAIEIMQGYERFRALKTK